MDADYWRNRWTEGRTGWHQDQPTPLMLKHWPTLSARPGEQVFVPLAGKTHDMRWFAAQGLRVLGVELSSLAIEQFFEESGLAPRVHTSGYGTHYEAAGIEIIHGDAFGLDRDVLAGCDLVFDRAALIALPPELRQRYAGELYAQLPARCRGLLVTLEYPQHEKAGPPFSVREDEARALYGTGWSVDVLERRDILAQQPGFVAEGVTALDTVVYRLDRRHAPAGMPPIGDLAAPA